MFKNKDIRTYDYITRLKHAKKFIIDVNASISLKTNPKDSIFSEINHESPKSEKPINFDAHKSEKCILPLEFKLLDIYKISDWKQTIDYALSKRDNTDGIVLHTLSGIDVQKWPKVNLAYKLKPIHLNTIDFLYIYIPAHNNYQLYLSSNYQTFNHALRSKSINDKISQEIFNYDLDKDAKMNENYFILFDCPYFEDMWKYEFNENDLKGLNLKDKLSKVKHPNILNSKDLNHPAILDKLIIESQYLVDEHRWQPIRIRYDKEYPNNYNVGLTNVSLIFDPPCFKSEGPIGREAPNKIEINETRFIPKNIESLIRTYIWDYITVNNTTLLPFSNEPIVMIDYLADSRDVVNYYNSNIVKIFAVSDSRTKLVDYTNVLKDLYLNAKLHKHVITILNQITHPRIYLNVFTSNNFENLFPQLIKSNDFNLSEINMIFVNNLNYTNRNLGGGADLGLKDIRGGADLNLKNLGSLNLDLDEILNSNIKDYCNVDTVILYLYLGNDFEIFYKKYSARIIDCFNPLVKEDFVNYLLNAGISKMEIDKYSCLINCAILKL